jgi:DNA-binding LacI/PurR family transcriptional regulator
MRHFQAASLAEQVAHHLREEIRQGSLTRTVPGVHHLASELGIHHTTAEAALKLLEKEGLLLPQGKGRRRRIQSVDQLSPPSLRIAILPYEDTNFTLHYLIEMQHRLQAAGHTVGFAEKTLRDLGMDAKRVAKFVNACDVDAWIVISGPREVLDWFAQQPKPAFAVFGRRRSVPIASIGPDKLPALLDSLDRLVELGHRKIVMLLREEHRKPKPGFVAQALLDAMKARGLQTGPYNLPDWKDNGDDFRRCLDALFRVTPPTALIIDEPFLFHVTQYHVSGMRLRIPADVSLVCADPDPTFSWIRPSIAHVRWDSGKVVQRVVQWANKVARGADDRRQSLIKAVFVDGGTIGPVPGREGER